MTDSMDLQHATDSVAAKVSSRFVMPALIFVLTLTLGIIGYMVKRAWDENTEALNKVNGKQDSLSMDVLQIKSDVRDVYTRMDVQVLRQVETNTRRLDRVESDVQQLKQAVKTP